MRKLILLGVIFLGVNADASDALSIRGVDPVAFSFLRTKATQSSGFEIAGNGGGVGTRGGGGTDGAAMGSKISRVQALFYQAIELIESTDREKMNEVGFGVIWGKILESRDQRKIEKAERLFFLPDCGSGIAYEKAFDGGICVSLIVAEKAVLNDFLKVLLAQSLSTNEIGADIGSLAIDLGQNVNLVVSDGGSELFRRIEFEYRWGREHGSTTGDWRCFLVLPTGTRGLVFFGDLSSEQKKRFSSDGRSFVQRHMDGDVKCRRE